MSREAILQSVKEEDVSVFKDELNKTLFNDKKFCKEVASVIVEHTAKMEILEEFIDFLASASEETR